MLLDQTFSSAQSRVVSPSEPLELNLDSTIQSLVLYEFQLDADCLGKTAAAKFEASPLLPGVILIEAENFAGMISRQQFLTQMSRPYSLELFFDRPLKSLHNFIETDILVLEKDTPIVEAAERSLHRSAALLHEPIVVKFDESNYQLLDVHSLLVAQSKIHKLTTQLLDEKTHSHLVQTEKMASLGRMVSGVSHEIKDPVNCINGNLDFLNQYSQDLLNLVSAYQREIDQKSNALNHLEEEIELDFLAEDLPKLLQSMGLASERLKEIVSSLRCFSRLDREKKQEIEIHDLIDSTLLILNNRLKAGVQVDKRYGALPAVLCYSGQLSQVFMNIISNAIDILLEKQETLLSEEQLGDWLPTITITTKVTEKSSKGSQGEWVSIQIGDNGTGIPTHIQARIFENFFTTKPVGKGTGLGLAISHDIVTQKHGGQLTVQSEIGVGTVFEIRIPLAQA